MRTQRLKSVFGWAIALAIPTLMACNAAKPTNVLLAEPAIFPGYETEAAPPFPEAKGTLVVLNQADGTLSVVRLKDGTTVRKIPVGASHHEVAVSPDGRTAVSCQYGNQGMIGNSLTVADIVQGGTPKSISLGEYQRPHGIAWLDKDRVLVTSELGKAVLVVNVPQAKVERAIPTEAEISHMLALSPDKKRVYTANIVSGSVSVLDIASGKSVGTIATVKGCEGIAVTPDGTTVWTGNTGAGSVSVVDVKEMKLLKTLPSPGFPIRAASSPVGRTVLVTHPQAGEIVFFDAKEMKELKRLKVSEGSVKFDADPASPAPFGMVVHPAGRYAYVNIFTSGAVAVVDIEKREIVAKIECGAKPDAVDYSSLSL